MGVAASAPDDVLERASGWLKKEDVLCLRGLSPRARDLAPKLTRLEWSRSDPSDWSDWDSDEEEAKEVQITELIVGRGGTAYFCYS